MKCYTTTQQVTQHNEDKKMTSKAQEQINQINTVLAKIENVDSLNTKYQLEIYKVFYVDVKRIMGA